MQKDNKRNMMLVKAEMVATVALLSQPIMTPFFRSLGLSQSEIALTQMAFTLVLMILNIPLGYVADRFGRKQANVVGDLLCAFALIGYAHTRSFWQIVACETLFGIGVAFSQGVDSTLLRHFCQKEDAANAQELYEKQFSRVTVVCEVYSFILILLGGPIGAISFRLAIGLSSIPLFIGAILSMMVEDDSPRLLVVRKETDGQQKKRFEAFTQMCGILQETLNDPQLRLRIMAHIVVRECTHGIIWIFTPLMMLVGVPLSIVSVGWALNDAMSFVGAFVANKYASRMRDWQIYATPIVGVMIASFMMFTSLNVFTVWLYGLFGMARGWVSATSMPRLKGYIENEAAQTTVESFARVCSQFLYVITVYVINRAADVELRYALLATVVIFLPLALPVIIVLKRENSAAA